MLIPVLNENEIRSLGPTTLSAIAYHCAESLLISDLEVLGKVMRYIPPPAQKESLIILLTTLTKEYDPACKEIVSSSIADVVVGNISHCDNEDFLEGAYKLAIAMLEDPITRSDGKRIAKELIPHLASPMKEELEDILEHLPPER